MSFFDPPKFPEPFKPEPLWQMNTCPTCQNNLVCHDQGECLRPTPETDEAWGRWPYAGPGVHANFARRLERERNKAREQLASEKATRNAIIAKGIEMEHQLSEAREENARLREALQANLFHHALACVWRHQDGTFDDKARVTEDSCQCPPKTKAFRKLLGTNSENKGFDP